MLRLLACAGKYWCDSFVGSKDINDTNLYWAPSTLSRSLPRVTAESDAQQHAGIGWVFAVMASVWGLFGCVLALLVPKTRQYTLIN
jgi:hypothetical protein